MEDKNGQRPLDRASIAELLTSYGGQELGDDAVMVHPVGLLTSYGGQEQHVLRSTVTPQQPSNLLWRTRTNPKAVEPEPTVIF